MELKFISNYLSIEKFNSINLSNFTLITGVNGSGKSQLLEAINKGNILITEKTNPRIVLFNYQNFKLENENHIQEQSIASEREQAWSYFEQTIKPNAQNWKKNLGEDYNRIKESNNHEKRSIWENINDKLIPYRNSIKDFFNSSSFKGNSIAQSLFSITKKLPYNLDEIEKDDFFEYYKPLSLTNDFLPSQLSKVIWDYHVKETKNSFRIFENERLGKTNKVLSNDEFRRIHGEPPWIILNKILSTFSTLQYQINSPEGMDIFGNYKLNLIHSTKKDLKLEFSHLSSGEKILMALVAAIYKSASDGIFPDILLLDEIDASLHPSMIQNLLNAITNIFLKENVTIILVTHSPTTIALAPEDSIYIMNTSGENRIEKKNKNEALKILTQGLTTLERGLSLLDNLEQTNFLILTEGKNTLLLQKFLELHSVKNVKILSGIEDISGKTQLKTLFDFFTKINHSTKIMFVWDCDANYQSLLEINNTYPYTFDINKENAFVMKGIENMFPSYLFDDFKKRIYMSNGSIIEEFDQTRKRDFEKFIVGRNNITDFINFEKYKNEIIRIQNLR